MRTPHHLKGHDFHGTCRKTGKRQYSSRRHARKARQAFAHNHGHPYLCPWCDYWHLGHYKKQTTRDGYRAQRAGRVHINDLANQLAVSPETVTAVLEQIDARPADDYVPAEIARLLKQITYRH